VRDSPVGKLGRHHFTIKPKEIKQKKEEEKMEKLFVVIRSGLSQIKVPTQEMVALGNDGVGRLLWFSPPLPEADALALKQKWSNIQHKPTQEECNDTETNALGKQKYDLISLGPIKMERYVAPKNYADGRMRKITESGIQYFWKIEDDQVRVFRDGNEILRYSGDPHDLKPAGVRSAIRDL
jgi:hypothetical protein